MSAKLYDLSGIYRKLLDDVVDWETGEVDESRVPNFAELMEEVEDSIHSKVDGCCKALRIMDSQAKALKQEEERLSKRRKSLENRIKGLRTYVSGCLSMANLDKVKTSLFTVSLGAERESVEIVDIKKLDEEYLKPPKEREVDKAKLKRVLSKGKKIAGAFLKKGERVLRIT